MVEFLGGSARDVEPFVDAGVNRRRSLVLVLGDVELAGVSAVVAVRDSAVGAACMSVKLSWDRKTLRKLTG